MLQLCIEQQLGSFQLSLNVEINHKGVTAIFGRSGAGKSSLINAIAGLTKPQKGRIQLNDHTLFDSAKNIHLPPEKRRVGYVFQEPRLFPHYRVERNLKYGCKRQDPAHFLQITHLLGIDHLLDRFPNSLSGGEQQRVAIGRALLAKPDILLMDEPLSALDLPRKKELLNYLSELVKTIDIPILYVSHSLDEIVRLADKLLLLDSGKITAYDQILNVWNSSAFAAWLPEAQRLSLLELPIVSRQSQYKMIGLELADQQIWINQQPLHQIGDKLRITIASRDVSLTQVKPEKTSIRNILLGQIDQIEPQSDRVDLAVRVAKQTIWVTISLWAFDELQLSQGQAVYLQIKSISIS